ncbi:MAG: hypothetical protein AB1941_23865 [Gemmatimonadota bacterium]
MADIDIERRGPGVWPWIIGLLVLGLLAWAVAEWVDVDEPEAVVPVAAVEPTAVAPVADPPPPVPVAQGAAVTLADVLGSPAAYFGRTVTPEAVRVTSVPSDRGFWVEEQGQRVFVVLNETAPGAAPGAQADVQGARAERPDLNPGDVVRIGEAMVHDPTKLQNVQGPLDDQTRRILAGLPVFLVTDGANVQKVPAT